MPHFFRLMALCLVAVLVSCSSQQATQQAAVDVQDGDVCAVCGMYLRDAPGPRAEAWVAGKTRPLMFDSIRDFFAWTLQPEHQQTARALYVQNSALIDWQHPTTAATSFIDARRASYVAWQPLPGSMGPTLAPFATRAMAAHFVGEHGGAVLTFDAITPELVASLGSRCPPEGTTGVPACRAAPAGSQPTPETGTATHDMPSPSPTP